MVVINHVLVVNGCIKPICWLLLTINLMLTSQVLTVDYISKESRVANAGQW